jgi:hypothetical protein
MTIVARPGRASCLLLLGVSSCSSASSGPTLVTHPDGPPNNTTAVAPPDGETADAGNALAEASVTDASDTELAAPGADAATDVTTDGGPADAGASKASDALSTCEWPASLNEAGPGACRVGRAYVECKYPSGVSCDGGLGGSSPGGLTMLCISDDPTSCQGCDSISGPSTCTNMCAPNEYAVSCGGPPLISSDGGFDNFAYQQAPANCVGVAGTAAGNEYSCCPCE